MANQAINPLYLPRHNHPISLHDNLVKVRAINRQDNPVDNHLRSRVPNQPVGQQGSQRQNHQDNRQVNHLCNRLSNLPVNLANFLRYHHPINRLIPRRFNLLPSPLHSLLQSLVIFQVINPVDNPLDNQLANQPVSHLYCHQTNQLISLQHSLLLIHPMSQQSYLR